MVNVIKERMTLRDKFAVHAILLFASQQTHVRPREGAEEIARRAYELADAMLEERKK